MAKQGCEKGFHIDMRGGSNQGRFSAAPEHRSLAVWQCSVCSMGRSYEEEKAFITREDGQRFRIDPGFVPNMKVNRMILLKLQGFAAFTALLYLVYELPGM